MAFSRDKWVTWMGQQNKQAEGGGRPVFWRPDPMWDRLHHQPSWALLLRVLGRDQRISVDCEYSATSRSYRCEMTRWTEEKLHRLERHFLAEGYGAHPLSAILTALWHVKEPICLTVKLALLEAFVDYLDEEMRVWRS